MNTNESSEDTTANNSHVELRVDPCDSTSITSSG